MHESLPQMARRVEAAMHSETCHCEFCQWCRGKVKAILAKEPPERPVTDFERTKANIEEYAREEADTAYSSRDFCEEDTPEGGQRCA